MISGNYLFGPHTVPGRAVSLVLTAYAVVIFASLAATLAAFFIGQRAEHAGGEAP